MLPRKRKLSKSCSNLSFLRNVTVVSGNKEEEEEDEEEELAKKKQRRDDRILEISARHLPIVPKEALCKSVVDFLIEESKSKDSKMGNLSKSRHANTAIIDSFFHKQLTNETFHLSNYQHRRDYIQPGMLQIEKEYQERLEHQNNNNNKFDKKQSKRNEINSSQAMILDNDLFSLKRALLRKQKQLKSKNKKKNFKMKQNIKRNKNDKLITRSKENKQNPFKAQSESLLVLNNLKNEEKMIAKRKGKEEYHAMNQFIFLKNRKYCRNSIWKECKDATRNNEHLTFSQLIRLHKMWQSYCDSALTKNQFKNDKISMDQINNDMNKIDLHGAFIKIVKCKAKCHYNGHEGIMVALTKNQFAIICLKPNKDQMCRIPFGGTIFSLRVLKEYVVIINGTNYNPTI